MVRVLFLILIVMSSIAFAQTDEKPKAYLFVEFGKATNGNVKMRMQSFYTAMNNNLTSEAYIVNYGTDSEIAMRERQIKNAVNFYKLDSFRLVLVRGGNIGELKTQFWVVPPGAVIPGFESQEKAVREEAPVSGKLEEFEKLTDAYVKIKIHRLFKEIKNNPKSQGYIINFGTAEEIAERERQIKDAIEFFKYDSSGVTFVSGGNRKVIKTQFWIVPEGVEPPKP